MNHSNKLIKGSIGLICRDLGIDKKNLQIEANRPDVYAQLKLKLTRVVQHLMDTNFNQFLNTMYRIDIDENDLKEALTMLPPDKIAAEVAEMIILREEQKVNTRLKYRKSGG